ncbi:MAG: hypothetical protein IJT43_07920 [Stomatobaculum sp.]|nr:hypothetical protein [Stomatobaculum sp.]
MKKKAGMIFAAGLLALTAACGQGTGKTETTPEATAAATTAAAETKAAETKAEEMKTAETKAEETKAEETKAAEDKVYKNSKGWQVRYDPSLIEVKEEKDGATFTYTGEAEGTDKVTISFAEGKQPEELLYELTSSWGDQEKIDRSEGFFPGAPENWAFWRVMNADTASDGIARTAIAGEYNGGVLYFDVETTPTGDDATDMQVSDVLAEVIDSIEFENFEPQTMYEYVPGTYTQTITEEIEGTDTTYEYSVILNKDHSGKICMQDDIDIYWSSIELMDANTPGVAWEYDIEGDNLMLNQDGIWLTFTKQPETSARSSGLAKDHVQTTDTEGCDTFTQIVDKKLADGQGYANVKLDETDVLLVSSNTYNGGEGKDAATDAEIFAYEDGKPVYLGCVMTGGTANPLMVKDGKLFAAGHHYVGKFTVTDGKLMVMEEVRESFDKDGNASYHYNSDDGGDYSNFDEKQAKEIFDQLLKEYADADILAFSTVKK